MHITLRKAEPSECQQYYDLMHEDLTWLETDYPFHPYEKPDFDAFNKHYFNKLCAGQEKQLIVVDGDMVGSVSLVWEDKLTQWLEIGIAIYRPAHWNKGIATIALQKWIDHVFRTQNVARIGLTTWSGNAGMMRVAEKLGMTQEARLRKVRFHQGVHYDALEYGILREEWIALKEN